MIRRLAASVFLLLYMGTSSGMAFSAHYCCGFLVDITVNTTSDHCEDTKGCHEEIRTGCCEESLVRFISDDHISDLLLKSFTVAHTLTSESTSTSWETPVVIHVPHVQTTGPPPLQDLYKRYNQLLIYL